MTLNSTFSLQEQSVLALLILTLLKRYRAGCSGQFGMTVFNPGRHLKRDVVLRRGRLHDRVCQPVLRKKRPHVQHAHAILNFAPMSASSSVRRSGKRVRCAHGHDYDCGYELQEQTHIAAVAVRRRKQVLLEWHPDRSQRRLRQLVG